MSFILPSHPEVSIITVCLNCRDLVEKTIQSVISQSYPNIQYIIIDGGSVDGTLDIIKKYKAHIDVIVSEKDDGLYYAMNKGIGYATGDIIYFLNSGDYLYDTNTIEMMCAQFDLFPDSDIVYGDIISFDDTGEQRLSLCRPTSLHVLTRCGICHQSLFAKRHLFNSFEPFNTKYHVYADYEWLLRSILLNTRRIHYFETPIAYYRAGGISQNRPEQYYHERIEVMDKYSIYFNKRDVITSSPKELIYYMIVYIYLLFGILYVSVSNLKRPSILRELQLKS